MAFYILQIESAGTSKSTFPVLVLFIRSRMQSSRRGTRRGGQGWLTNGGGPGAPASNHTAPARISAGQLHVSLHVPGDGQRWHHCAERLGTRGPIRRGVTDFHGVCSRHCSAPVCETDCRSWVSEKNSWILSMENFTWDLLVVTVTFYSEVFFKIVPRLDTTDCFLLDSDNVKPGH